MFIITVVYFMYKAGAIVGVNRVETNKYSTITINNKDLKVGKQVKNQWNDFSNTAYQRRTDV